MKEQFRQSMAWLHTWAGLITGWVLFFVFVTGSATYFKHEITRWMQPEMPLRQEVQLPPAQVTAELALDYLKRQPEPSPYWRITLPDDGRRAGYPTCSGAPGCPAYPGLRGYPRDLTVQWAGHEVRLDSTTGEELPPYAEVRETGGGDLLDHMHHSLYYLPGWLGPRIVAICTLLALLALVTGIVVHKRIFKDFFTFRPGKGQRSWLDGHNVVSVMALPFFLMITYSGLAERNYLPKPLLDVPAQKQAIEPPAVQAPAPDLDLATIPLARIVERAESILGVGQVSRISMAAVPGEPPTVHVGRQWGTQYPFASRSDNEPLFNAYTGEPLERMRTFGLAPAHQALWWVVGPHFGWFAGAGLRWLLFICGLLGCVTIATGLVLWAVKRREKHAKRNDAPWGVALVEWLNVSVIVGLPVGVAAYFWANRLLPVALEHRAEWEAHTLFFTWGWLFLYAALRPRRQSWLEMLWLAAAAFGLIPLLNALTTDKHLGATLAAGDWVLAGFDLTMLALAATFAAVAFKLRRKRAGRPSSRSQKTPEVSI